MNPSITLYNISLSYRVVSAVLKPFLRPITAHLVHGELWRCPPIPGFLGEGLSSNVAQLLADHVSIDQGEVVITDRHTVHHDVALVRKPPALQCDPAGAGGGVDGVERDGVVRVAAVPGPGYCSFNISLIAASLPTRQSIHKITAIKYRRANLKHFLFSS